MFTSDHLFFWDKNFFYFWKSFFKSTIRCKQDLCRYRLWAEVMLNSLISPVSLLYKIMDWYNWCVILALNPWLLMTKYARLFGHQNIFCNLAHSYDWWKQYDSKCLGLHPDPIWPRNSWCLKCHRLSKKNRHKMKRLDYNNALLFPQEFRLGSVNYSF